LEKVFTLLNDLLGFKELLREFSCVLWCIQFSDNLSSTFELTIIR
jgi:hypothetical protein